MDNASEKVIYDIGANVGANIPYYLLKADKVVAIEANPVLASKLSTSFSNEIQSGRLIIENCVLIDRNADRVPFYIHRTSHVHSQFDEPTENRSAFDEVMLPAKAIVDLISIYGSPYYVKVDVEHLDEVILKSLFHAGIRPPYISAESHSSRVFACLVSLGEYSSFKLMDGATVHTKYASMECTTKLGTRVIQSFPVHSAGPFGADIQGPWLTTDNLFRLLGSVGLGWKDIHASRIDKPDENYCPKPNYKLSVEVNY